MKIILGSKSKARREILKKLGFEFEVREAGIDEKAIRFSDPKKLTLALAAAKKEALVKKIKEPAILITSDQVVIYQNEIREKPKDVKEAKSFLESYQFHPAETVTAVVVFNTVTKKTFQGVDVARVWFKPIPEAAIKKLIAAGEIFHQAGGFSITDPYLKPYIKKVVGEAESVLGLPKKLTLKLIIKARAK